MTNEKTHNLKSYDDLTNDTTVEQHIEHPDLEHEIKKVRLHKIEEIKQQLLKDRESEQKVEIEHEEKENNLEQIEEIKQNLIKQKKTIRDIHEEELHQLIKKMSDEELKHYIQLIKNAKNKANY